MKVVKLDTRIPENLSAEHALALGMRSFQQATRIIAASIENSFDDLEKKLELLREVIETIPDPAVAAGLAQEHLEIMKMIEDARRRIAIPDTANGSAAQS